MASRLLVISNEQDMLLIGDLLAPFQVFHRCNDDRGMFWRRHKLVAGSFVFGKTDILAVRAFVSLRVVQALSPWQRELTKVRDHSVQLALIALFQLLFEHFERCSSYGLPRKNQ
jgi:hypothetical protein